MQRSTNMMKVDEDLDMQRESEEVEYDTPSGGISLRPFCPGDI